MNIFKSILPVLFILSFCLEIFSFNSFTVLDPKAQWRNGRGKIEDATLSVHPKGIYTEVSYYLTLSSQVSGLTSSSDTLEAVLNFDLPASSLMVDSWLWIEKDIVQADIVDRWTATNIYENIVKRRRDPSI